MDSSLILSNILNPLVLFFLMGMMAVFLKPDLELPHTLPKLFSLGYRIGSRPKERQPQKKLPYQQQWE